MNKNGKQPLLEELLARLSVERLEEDNFRGRRQKQYIGNAFGGQIIGQALSAAYQTVVADRSVHSLHAYFFRPADATLPVTYVVDRLRDGAGFNTRRVTALQTDKAVFSMLTSFQMEEQGLEHQDEMPDVPGPEQCGDAMPGLDKFLAKIPHPVRKRLLSDKPVEIRYVDPDHPSISAKRGDRFIWFRSVGPMPEGKSLHRIMLAYVSDYSLVATPLYRHGRSFFDGDLRVASLDHAMWFQRDFRLDEWLLYAIHSPSASEARGLSIAHVFTQDGAMAATVAQEGLMRFGHKTP